MYDIVMVGIGHRMFVKTNGIKKKRSPPELGNIMQLVVSQEL